MNSAISQFIETVCRQVKYKKIHRELAQELMGHIDEIMEDCLERGMSEEEAAHRAIKQMGDPVAIGRDLHKTHQPKVEWSIIILVGTLVLMGGGILFSIARDPAYQLPFDYFSKRYFFYTLVGLGAFLGCYYFDYTLIEKYALKIFCATLLFLFIGIGASPYSVNGDAVFVSGSFTISMVTITLPVLLISYAGLLRRWGTGELLGILKLVGLGGLAIILSFIHSTLPNAILLSGGFVIMLTISILDKSFKGNRLLYLIGIYGTGALGGLLYLKSSYIRWLRLTTFLYFRSYPESYAYQYTIVKEILREARLLGSSQALYHQNAFGKITFSLSSMDSEFVFTYLVGAFGWLAGIFMLIVISLVIGRMFLAAKKIHHPFGRYGASAVVTVFTLQAMANLLMNLSLFPITSFSLPFISYGGGNFTMNMALIGLLLGIYRRKDILPTGISAGSRI